MWRKRNENVKTIEQARIDRLGIRSLDELDKWMKKGSEDAYNLPGIASFEKIVLRDYKRPVRIIGDYDVDGITAVSILVLTFLWMGFTNVRYIIPKRCRDGYGMNRNMVDQIREENALIITVDNGIAAFEAVEYAKQKGHTVIVTDHHEPVKTENAVMIPKADLVIDPKVMPWLWDFDGYCGAGIAYKIARKMLGNRKMAVLMLLPLAAFGTLCDQMYIREENFFFVKAGLHLLNLWEDESKYPKHILPGIRAIGHAMKISPWTSDAVVYKLGPAVNSGERKEDGGALTAVKMFTGGTPYICSMNAGALVQANEWRKQTQKSVEEHLAEPERDSGGNVIYPVIQYSDDCPEGITGIVAGKLSEKYNAPAAVFSPSSVDPNVLKGSFRSPEGFHIMDLIEKCRSEFVACGGHAAAAGASVSRQNFQHMVKALQDAAPKGKVFVKENLYDLEITNADVEAAIAENQKAAPFGNGNPDLVFKVTGFKPVRRFDMKGNGIKLVSEYSSAIGFNIRDTEKINGESPLTIYGTIAMNVFNGKSTPQIMILGIERE